MSCFNGKVIVITGAGSGIGRALAQQLAAKGARLAVSDVDTTSLAETLRSLPGTAEVRSYTLDVSNRQAVFAHAEDVRRDFGTAHFVINNAGATIFGTVAHLDIDEIEWLLGINLWGVIYGTKAFLPMMLAQREGCIINISSVLGLVAYGGQSAYCISKFGVRGFTECLWSELEGSGRARPRQRTAQRAQRPAEERAGAAVEELKAKVAAITQAAADRVSQRQRQVLWLTIAATASTVLLGLLVAALITARLTRPVRSLVTAVRAARLGGRPRAGAAGPVA